MNKPGTRPVVGDKAILNEGDWCGTQTIVTVLKIHKGGNCKVLDGDRKRECALHNLTKVEDQGVGS